MSPQNTKPADWSAFLHSQGLQSGVRMDQGDWNILMKKYQEFTAQSQASAQGLGLAQQMARMGMGPGRPVLNDQTGRYQTPMDPTAATAVGLMQSPGPRASGIALALQRLDPQAQAQLANSQAQQQGQVLDNTAKGMGITQAGIMNPLNVQKARQDLTMGGLQITGQGLQNSLSRAQLSQVTEPPSQAQQDAQIWQRDNGAAIPKDFRPQRRFTKDPRTGQALQFVDVQPVEGTPAWRTAEDEVRLRESMVGNINDFLDTLAQVGTEYRGEHALKLSELRRRVLGDYAQLLKLGVLQPSEMQNLQEILPDPTAFGNQLNPWAAENIGSVYDQLGSFYGQQLKDARLRNWFIPTKKVLPEDAARGK